MNLAQVTSALSAKDSERTAVREEIKKLEDLKFQDFSGILHLHIFHIDGLEGQTLEIDYEIAPEDSFLSKDGLRKRSVADNIIVYTRTQELDIKFIVKSFATGVFTEDAEPTPGVEPEEGEIVEVLEKTEHRYIATFKGEDVPTDTEMRTELVGIYEGTDESITVKPVLHVKASYDTLEALLKSKQLELDQIQAEFDDLGKQIKDSRKPKEKSSTVAKGGKKGGMKKKRQSSAHQNKEIEDDSAAAESDSGPASYLTQAVQFGASAIAISTELGFQYRGFIMFGLATLAIIKYGEYASV